MQMREKLDQHTVSETSLDEIYKVWILTETPLPIFLMTLTKLFIFCDLQL